MSDGLPFQQEQELAFVVATTANPSQGFPLGAAGTHTFNTICVAGYSVVRGYVITDQPGNLFIEQTINGKTFDISNVTAVAAGVAATVNQVLYGKSARVRFVNTGGVQTYFRGNIVARPI